MKNIATALVKAQREFGPALKTSTNPHFRSKYADLSACIEAVIDGLNNNGIALLQPMHESDNGVTVETLFLHESGEMLSAGKLHVPAAKQDPQGYGSALTYARRYSLMAACGIAPEDDDGNAAKAPKRIEQQEASADPFASFTPQAAKTIRAVAASAIEHFSQGDELGAFEEVLGCVDKLGGDDNQRRNDVMNALAVPFKPHSALRAMLKEQFQKMHAHAKQEQAAAN